MSAPKNSGAMAPKETPKTMSSRLLTMKFMQRATASAVSSPGSPSTPPTDGSSKRRKTKHFMGPDDAASTPGTPTWDQAAIAAALAEEEKKRVAAIEKQALELGDSHWELTGGDLSSGQTVAAPRKTLNVVQVGFAQIDSSSFSAPATGGDDSGDNERGDGALFLRFNMKDPVKPDVKEQRNKRKADSAESDSEEEGEYRQNNRRDDSDRRRSYHGSGNGYQDRGRNYNMSPEERKRARSSFSRRDDERKRAHDYADKRRKKEIPASRLTSISSGGSFRRKH